MDEIIKNLDAVVKRLEKIADDLDKSKYHEHAQKIREMRITIKRAAVDIEQDFLSSAGLA